MRITQHRTRAFTCHPFGVKHDTESPLVNAQKSHNIPPTTHHPHSLLGQEIILSGFGHLVGPIMGVFALFGGDFAILFIGRFVAYSNIGRVITTSEGVILTKQAILREFKTLFCANAHAKSEKSPSFAHKTPLFAFLTRFLLFRLICPQEGGFGATRSIHHWQRLRQPRRHSRWVYLS